jgi:hypothetical protein
MHKFCRDRYRDDYSEIKRRYKIRRSLKTVEAIFNQMDDNYDLFMRNCRHWADEFYLKVIQSDNSTDSGSGDKAEWKQTDPCMCGVRMFSVEMGLASVPGAENVSNYSLSLPY